MRFIEAVLILSGMIIGAGMFGIPFSFARAGFWLGTAELIVLSGVVLLLHLLYGEVVLKTPEYHRLPGYVNMYLGRRAGMLARASTIFGISGALLAYVILGSLFLQNIFTVWSAGRNEFFWALAVVLAGALITFFPLRKEALINGILTVALIGFMVFLIVILLPQVRAENLSGFNFRNTFVPYGILLFALSGGVVVPDLITFLGRERKLARPALVIGSLLPAFLYFLFAFSVVGGAGDSVSKETIRGLQGLAGDAVFIIGSVIGFLAVFTSFIVLSGSFQAMFRLDLGMPRFFSWVLVSFAPLALYAAGFKDFIAVIGVVGAVAIGVDSALVIASYHNMQKSVGVLPSPFSYIWKLGIYVMIVSGVVYEIYSLFIT